MFLFEISLFLTFQRKCTYWFTFMRYFSKATLRKIPFNIRPIEDDFEHQSSFYTSCLINSSVYFFFAFVEIFLLENLKPLSQSGCWVLDSPSAFDCPNRTVQLRLHGSLIAPRSLFEVSVKFLFWLSVCQLSSTDVLFSFPALKVIVQK